MLRHSFLLISFNALNIHTMIWFFKVLVLSVLSSFLLKNEINTPMRKLVLWGHGDLPPSFLQDPSGSCCWSIRLGRINLHQIKHYLVLTLSFLTFSCVLHEHEKNIDETLSRVICCHNQLCFKLKLLL
jgi:hypothetical protein